MFHAFDVELLVEHIQNYLDTDPVLWREDEAAFDFCGERVFYQRFLDHFKVEVAGSHFVLPRL